MVVKNLQLLPIQQQQFYQTFYSLKISKPSLATRTRVMLFSQIR